MLVSSGRHLDCNTTCKSHAIHISCLPYLFCNFVCLLRFCMCAFLLCFLPPMAHILACINDLSRSHHSCNSFAIGLFQTQHLGEDEPKSLTCFSAWSNDHASQHGRSEYRNRRPLFPSHCQEDCTRNSQVVVMLQCCQAACGDCGCWKAIGFGSAGLNP